jgi:hypothetical protein
MTDDQAILSFESIAIGLSRQLPLAEARPFLRGLILLTEGRPEMGRVQSVYADLCTVDDQLELIASGLPRQQRLPLSPVPARSIHHEPAGGPSL